MVEGRKKKTLHQLIGINSGEEIYYISRQHWFVFRNAVLLSFFVPFLTLSIIYFIDYWIIANVFINTIIQILILVSLICFFLGMVLFFWKLFLWFRTLYIVTNKRLIIIRQRGLFGKDRRETSLDMVQDVAANVPGLQAALYGFGDVVVQISAKQAELVMETVGKPYIVQRKIMQVAKLDASAE